MKWLNLAKFCKGNDGKALPSEPFFHSVLVCSERTFRGVRLFSYADLDAEGNVIIIVVERRTGCAVPGGSARSGLLAWAGAEKAILSAGAGRTKKIIRETALKYGVANGRKK